MATTSAVPLVIDQIIELLQDLPGLAEAEVIDGLGRNDEPLLVVAIGDTSNWTREFTGLPSRTLAEDFDLNFWIRVRQPGMTQKESRDVAYDFLAAMDELFVDQPAFARLVPQVHRIQLLPSGLLELPTDEGPHSYITGVISLGTRFRPKD